MKKILLITSLLLYSALSFGQATGYALPNFTISGSIGTAATTVDVYSRININQTTPSITLTVQNPSNPSTKVTEVWIGNTGSVKFTLRNAGLLNFSEVVDTNKAVILKWTGLKWYVIGGAIAPDLSAYIKRDGTSAATTGNILIGNSYGLTNTSSVYHSRSIVSSIGFFKTDANYYSGSMPFKLSAISSTYRNVFGFSDAELYWNIHNIGNNKTYISATADQGILISHLNNLTFGSVIGLDTSGITLAGKQDLNAVDRRAVIRTSLFTGVGVWNYDLPNYGGRFAMTTDTLPVDQTKVPYFSSGISGTPSSSTYLRGDGVWSTVAGGVTSVFGRTGAVTATSGDYTTAQVTESGNLYYTDVRARAALSATTPLSYNSGTGVFSMPAATTSVSGYLSSTDWNTFNNKIGLTSLSGTSGVSYNNTTGAISFNLATGNIWTSQQTAPSWYANGTGGAGYLQIANQSSAPAAISGNLIISSDNLNRLTLIRRNIANSADITRTLSFPDASYSWTYPTPASGTTSTLAGLETAQTFTEQNTFSNTSGQNIYSLQIRDVAAGSYKTAISSPSGNQLKIDGFGATMGINLNANTIVNGVLYTNTISSTSGGNTLTLNAFGTGLLMTSVSRSTATATKVGYGLVTGNHTGAVSGANTQDITYLTGSSTSASGTGSTTGSHLFAIGTVAGTGTRGGVSFFNGFSGTTATEPAWNNGQGIIYVGNRFAAPIGNPTSGYYMWGESGDATIRSSGGGVTSVGTAGVSMQTVGQGLLIKEGTNATLGRATLVGGTITVNTTKVTANSEIFVTIQSPSGTLGTVYVSARTAGTSFTITSTSALDTSIVAWFIVEPN